MRHSQKIRIIRMPEVVERTGFSRTWIYELIRAGKFPRQHKIGQRAVGFSSEEIDSWIQDRLQKADTTEP